MLKFFEYSNICIIIQMLIGNGYASLIVQIARIHYIRIIIAYFLIFNVSFINRNCVLHNSSIKLV